MMNEPDSKGKNELSDAEFPEAVVRPRHETVGGLFRSSKMWVITAACLVFAVVLVAIALGSGGRKIFVEFSEGHGIKPGDTMRYRGIDVGRVTSVRVANQKQGVSVEIELDPSADHLARQGSRFWIERPQVGLARISGLETVVGAKYIGVIPGDSDAPLATSFQGEATPPVLRNQASETQLTVHFKNGHGLVVGDVVKHLGIVIGEVTAVRLQANLGSVEVVIRLSDNAQGLARAGSQFWIERPQLSLAEIRGLDTLVRGQYIAVIPGPVDGKPVFRFQGLEKAPPSNRGQGGLEIVVYSSQRHGLNPGVPVTYRGVTVGNVLSVGIAADASTVEARVYGRPELRQLIRVDSVFWSESGVDVDVGLSGFSLKTDSLQSIATGSLAFATPETHGRAARTGDRLEFFADSDDRWLDWNPKIAVGPQQVQDSTAVVPQRIAMTWQRKRLGFDRQEQKSGWVLLTDQNEIIGLKETLTPGEGAIEGSVMIELAGQQIAFKRDQIKTNGSWASYQVASDLVDDLTKWPAARVRRPEQVEDCLIFTDPQQNPYPLSSNHVKLQDGTWILDESISFDPSMEGGAVIALSDGQLVGFLAIEKGQARIVLADLP